MTKIQIIGSTCSGKSTLGEQLAGQTGYPLVELDALNWEPHWHGLHQHHPDKFRHRIVEATACDSWIVVGNYTKFSQELTWPRADTIIWLDLPRPLLTVRLLRRSWQRWRSKELLWGTNYENFWAQLKIWSDDSLLSWLWKTYENQRASHLNAMKNPNWAHLKFLQMKTLHQIKSFKI